MNLKRISPVKVLLEHEGTIYFLVNENGHPLSDRDMREIVDEQYTFLEVTATFQAIPQN